MQNLSLRDRVVVDGYAFGVITEWHYSARTGLTYDVELENGYSLVNVDNRRLVLRGQVVSEPKQTDLKAIAALKADIKATERTLRNLKSALVLIEGA